MKNDVLAQADWLTFREDDNALIEAWKSTTGSMLSKVSGMEIEIVELHIPNKEEARIAWKNNVDLRGRITFAGGISGSIDVPMPFEGVFIGRNAKGTTHSLVWDSWLGEKIGIRHISVPASESRRNANVQEWRVGLIDGRHFGCEYDLAYRHDYHVVIEGETVDEVCDRFGIGMDQLLELNPNAKKGDVILSHDQILRAGRKIKVGNNKGDLTSEYRAKTSRLRSVVPILKLTLATCSGEPWVAEIEEIVNTFPDHDDDKAWLESDALYKLDKVIRHLINVRQREVASETDEEDLAYRQLLTFPIWLRFRLCQRAAELKRIKLLNSEDLWRLEYALVPLAPVKDGNDRPIGGMGYVDPRNAIELVARIHGVKRFCLTRKAAEGISADRRQNHRSFEGRLCPIESPESEMVGISLQLAIGAKIDSQGIIIQAEKKETTGGQVLCQDMLGWGVSLIPFLHHNDGARNMMGAKNIRQALPVKGREKPVVRTGVEGLLVGEVESLCAIGVCPDSAKDGQLALGCDLLVAYLPWYGWNVDDAIVISDAVCDKMSVTKVKSFSRYVQKNWHEDNPGVADDAIEEKDSDKVIAVLRGPRDNDVERIVITDDGQLSKDVKYSVGCEDGCDGEKGSVLNRHFGYSVSKEFKLGVGDKLMGRHGNKGVVALVVPKENMPYFTINGRREHVEVLLNPHGVLSRMNPSQLLETHVGWLLKRNVCTETDIKIGDLPLGYPVVGNLDHNKIRQYLKKSGLDKYGKVELNWAKVEDPKSGETLWNDGKAGAVVVGYQHFFRLDHLPGLKAQARHGGDGYGYDSRSGQALHGRFAGGGQRFGEMEMWGLRAYGSKALLGGMVSKKSDKVLACKQGAIKSSLWGFRSYFHDWLRALLVEVKMANDGMSFEFLGGKDGRIRELCGGEVHEVKTSKIMEISRRGVYHCPECGKEFMHAHEFAAPERQRNMNKLELGNLFKEFNCKINGPMCKVDGAEEYKLPVLARGALQTDFLVKVLDYTPHATLLKVSISLLDGFSRSLFGDLPKEIYCFRRCLKDDDDAEKLLGRLTASGLDDGIAMIQDISDSVSPVEASEPWRDLERFNVVCACKTTKKGKVKFNESSGVVLSDVVEKDVPVSGGLYDGSIFAKVNNDQNWFSAEKWGYIELPFAIEVGELWEALFLSKGGPGVQIRALPVLPLRYRRPVGVDGGSRLIGDKITEKYVDLMRAIEAYKVKCTYDQSIQEMQKLEGQVKGAVKSVLKYLMDKFCGKEGLLRYDGLGRRVDRSCRLVVTPNPRLKLDEVALPAEIIRELFIGEKAGRKENKTCVGWSWHSWRDNFCDASQTCKEVEEYRKKNKDARILINRQPSLHRESMQSFKPIVQPVELAAGPVMQIPPLCCKGFGADFDGDEMVGHAIAETDHLVLGEVAQMSSVRNMLSVDSGAPSLNLDRDFVSGRYVKAPQMGKEASDEWLRETIGDGKNGCADKIMDEFCSAVAACTQNGLSFGYYDLLDKKGRDCEECDGALGVMLNSGANGTSQIVQYLKARGRLLPGDSCCLETTSDFEIRSNLVDGMPWDDIFLSSWNARSSMCDKKLGTQSSGDLTRKLVFALQGETVVGFDCGCDKHSILNCKAENGVCAKCYGMLPNRVFAKQGDPIGLLAALAIGERGTQLSMKSAHTSGGRNDFAKARSIILTGYDGNELINGYEDFHKRVTDCAPDYNSVAECHFHVLWRVLQRAVKSSNDGKAGVNNVLHNLPFGFDYVAYQRQGDLIRRIWSGAVDSIGFVHSQVASTLFGVDEERKV